MMTGAEVMTDYQFKSIIKMAATIVKSAENKEEAVKELEKLVPESAKESSKE